MTDLAPPPAFRATVEESLSIPSFGNGSGDSASITSSIRRRWDDPPEEEPGQIPQENMTSMVFVKTLNAHHGSTPGEVRTAAMQSEIMQLTFTPRDTHIAAMVPKQNNMRSFDPDESCALALWTVKEQTRRITSPSGLRVHNGFCFRPGGMENELVVACPFFVKEKGMDGFDVKAPMMEVYDVGKKVRYSKVDIPVRAPLVMSEDGSLLAGVSTKNSSRIVICGFGTTRTVKVKTIIIKHTGEVTRMGFLRNGRGLVSAGRDGYVRVTDLHSGKTLKRIEIGARAACSILQVSTDGDVVVTVWGRDVVLWFLDTGRVHNYNLNVVRQTEGWPLAVSRDCKYLACRTEDGFDVSDAASGSFRGDFAAHGSVITAAAFSNDCTKIAVGNYDGNVDVFDIIAA